MNSTSIKGFVHHYFKIKKKKKTILSLSLSLSQEQIHVDRQLLSYLGCRWSNGGTLIQLVEVVKLELL